MTRLLNRRNALALAGAAATTLSACTPSRQRTLRVTFSPLASRTIFERIGQAFAAAHPGWSIEYEGSRSYEDLTQKTLREAIVEDLPDLSHQGLSNVRLLDDRRLPVPLGPWICADPRWPGLGYIPELTHLAQFGDHIAGIPFAISVPAVFYNLTLVTKSGGDPHNLPVDWPGILNLARRIRTRGGPGIISAYIDYTTSNAWTFQSLVLGAGGRMTTPDEQQPAFGGPEGEAAMDILGQFHEAGQIDISREQASQAFAAGALGVFVTACSNLGPFRAQSGNRFKVAMRPLPLLAPSGRIPAGGNAIVITARDPVRQRAAWDYARFVLSAPTQAAFVRATGYIPTNRITIESPRLLGDLYAHDTDAAAPVSQIPRLAPWYSFPGPDSIRITNGLKLHMQEVVSGRAAPRAALAAMVAETQRLMRSR